MRRARLLLFSAGVLVPGAAWPQGDPVGPEFRVNTYTTGSQVRPSVAADTSGNFVVVWESDSEDGSSYGIFGQRYASSGAPLGLEFRVNTYTTGDQDPAGRGLDGSGNFVVVWQSDRQDGATARGLRPAVRELRRAPRRRVPCQHVYDRRIRRSPSIAADASGNFVVVWDSNGQDGSNIGVFGQRYSSSGVPLGPEFRVNTYTTGDQVYPSVTADASGNFVVIWDSDMQDGRLRGVFGQRYASSGAPLGPEFQVNTYTLGRQEFSAVAADPSGNFVVTWTSQFQDGSLPGIFGQRYASSGAPLGPEFRVNTYTTFYQDVPSVAADAAGNFVVTWASFYQDASGNGVFGQRYDASGAPLGPEFRVNTYTTASQAGSAVASDAAGNFVVTWLGQLQDGSGYGILGQRYNQIVPVELMEFGVE